MYGHGAPVGAAAPGVLRIPIRLQNGSELLGIEYNAYDSADGLRVALTGVVAGGAGERAGLQPGYDILSLDGMRIDRSEDVAVASRRMRERGELNPVIELAPQRGSAGPGPGQVSILSHNLQLKHPNEQLGFDYGVLTADTGQELGVLTITQVAKDGPAFRAQVQAGCDIFSLDGVRVRTEADLRAAVAGVRSGGRVTVALDVTQPADRNAVVGGGDGDGGDAYFRRRDDEFRRQYGIEADTDYDDGSLEDPETTIHSLRSQLVQTKLALKSVKAQLAAAEVEREVAMEQLMHQRNKRERMRVARQRRKDSSEGLCRALGKLIIKDNRKEARQRASIQGVPRSGMPGAARAYYAPSYGGARGAHSSYSSAGGHPLEHRGRSAAATAAELWDLAHWR
eukprot:TRINITY_DN19191_c0_g1_i1.p1 TRINITY_DN19191_c0_g1~~TRINITY_DN19191_c0_g1_i1.p1  ORF type:complete len:396 (+),score=132.80 TRINITY_DN19191_c0_g1_i1:65-1252(+)